ncbi:MAG: ferritin-like domain-containing protein [Ignavibacteriaceae bacterium]
MATAKVKTLEDLFLDELKDIYNAENQLSKALPKMAKKAVSEELRTAIEDHLKETENQIERLEKVFAEIDQTAKGKICKAMKGLIEEGTEIMEEASEDEVRDAGIISAAQKVEHYEIASYGTLVTFAKTLGYKKAADLLQETLDEEKKTDQLLSELAVSGINEGADKEE